MDDDDLDARLADTLADVQRTRAELTAWRAEIEASGRRLPPEYVAKHDQATAHADAQAETLHQIIRAPEIRRLDGLLTESTT